VSRWAKENLPSWGDWAAAAILFVAGEEGGREGDLKVLLLTHVKTFLSDNL
jgi:hypothetical protein